MAKQDKLNRVPPFLPLLWQDWRSSPSVRTMTMAQRGIYIEILIEQWIYGSFPRGAWQLSRRIGSEFRTTGRLLEKYSELAVCCHCGASWTPVTCQCGASNLTATCHNPKLKNLRKDVDSDLALGTTELNLTQPKLREPHLASASPTGGGGGVSNPVVDGYFDQGNKGDGAVVEAPEPSVVKDDLIVNEFIAFLGMVNAPPAETYGHWSRVFARLVESHGEPKLRNIMGYCFRHERYCRGIKTVKKEDKADWFAEHFEELADRMIADEEFDARLGAKAAKYRGDEKAPDYIKNPSGNVNFGKSVV